MTTVLNGWDVDAMTEAVEGVRQDPASGRLRWRGRVRWDGGFGLDARTLEIEQAGEVLPRRFTMRGDHPPELLGDNTGPTAVELLFGALGSCMAGTFAAQATARGVKIESLTVEVAGDIDLNGFFGLQPVPAGVSDVQLRFEVRSPADEAMLAEILETARSLSPVFDSVTRPIAVETSLRKG
jgi:uncharacterized OsmC-like protein